MGMYVSGWMVDSRGEEPKYTFRLEAMATAQDMAEMLRIKELGMIRSAFDVGEHGRISARAFKKLQLMAGALKDCVSITVNGAMGATANIMDIKWGSLSIESGISSEDEQSDRVLVSVKGTSKKTSPEDMHHLLLFCESGVCCEVKWVDIQSDIDDNLSGEELMYVLRTGKLPAKAEPEDATVSSFHLAGNGGGE